MAGTVALGATAGGAGPPDGDLPARVLARLQTDRQVLRGFSYVESAVLEKRASDGAVRSRTTEIYEVFLQDGRTMKRPLSLDLAQDSQGFGIVRREESRFVPKDSRAGETARPVNEGPFEIEHLIHCFRFEQAGEDRLADRPTFRVGFTPIDGCLDDGSRAGRLLQNLAGTLWVDEAGSDIVRIQGRLDRPVTFGFGLLGRIDQLDLEVDREPLAPGLYALTHVDYRARGTSFIFHRFDVRSIRDRSAYAPLAAGSARPPADKKSAAAPVPEAPRPPR